MAIIIIFGVLLTLLTYHSILAAYHWHQHDRILDSRGKQTFKDWILFREPNEYCEHSWEMKGWTYAKCEKCGLTIGRRWIKNKTV